MSDRSKYWLNGVYKCENFARYVRYNNFPRFHIGYASGFHWSIEFRTKLRNGSAVAYPFICLDFVNRKTQVRAYFNILKKDGSSSYETECEHLYLESSEGCIGKYMSIEDLFHQKNGYLDEGALTVEYGLQVESIKERDGIWIFNFFDRYFNWQTQENTFNFLFRHKPLFFGHMQIMKLHSKKISDSNKDWDRIPKSLHHLTFLTFLQITHGVRIQMTFRQLEMIARTAFRFGFTNALRYCEGQLIEMDEQIKMKLTRKIKLAAKYNMEHYLNHLIKQIGSPKRLISVLRRLDIEKMSSESMKTLVKKLFNFVFDFLE